MSAISKKCIAATCGFENAVMSLIAVSWAYTFIRYWNIEAFTLPWLAWFALFLGSVYWVFNARKTMKKTLAKLK